MAHRYGRGRQVSRIRTRKLFNPTYVIKRRKLPKQDGTRMVIQNDDVVKSVGRVFEVLELFDREKEALNATQVERMLNYPQSSTLALLKSMVKLGYLSFDRIERSYFPTMRVAMLGQWLENSAYGEGYLPTLVEEVSRATGETVSISCQNDLAMQFIQTRPGTKPLTLNIVPGTLAPLFESVIGITALSSKEDGEISKIIDRYNRRARRGGRKVVEAEVMAAVAKVRRDGYGVTYDTYIHSIGAIAWLLPPRTGRRFLVLSVAGPGESIQAEETDIVRAVNRILKTM